MSGNLWLTSHIRNEALKTEQSLCMVGWSLGTERFQCSLKYSEFVSYYLRDYLMLVYTHLSLGPIFTETSSLLPHVAASRAEADQSKGACNVERCPLKRISAFRMQIFTDLCFQCSVSFLSSSLNICRKQASISGRLGEQIQALIASYISLYPILCFSPASLSPNFRNLSASIPAPFQRSAAGLGIPPCRQFGFCFPCPTK